MYGQGGWGIPDIMYHIFSGVLPEYSTQKVILTNNCFDNRYPTGENPRVPPSAHTADLCYTTVVTKILRPRATPI